MFYVYEWYIIDTNEVIYVGKGVRNRYKVRKHNKMFNEMIKRFDCDSRIVKEFESEKDAFAYEHERVNELREMGQCVCNIYDGGRGGTTEWWTNELKDKYSEKNVMKSKEQRERMSKNNPMKNPSIAEKTNAKKRIAIIIGGVEYPSIADASKAFNVSSSTINAWCMKGETSLGLPCRYKDADKKSAYKHKNDGQKRKVIYKGVHYDSSTELGIAIGVNQATASRWCRKGRDPYGNPCRYVDDTRTDDEIPITQKNIPVIVNGIWYPSKGAACKACGITLYVLGKYLNGEKNDGKFVCDYA